MANKIAIKQPLVGTYKLAVFCKGTVLSNNKIAISKVPVLKIKK